MPKLSISGEGNDGGRVRDCATVCPTVYKPYSQVILSSTRATTGRWQLERDDDSIVLRLNADGVHGTSFLP